MDDVRLPAEIVRHWQVHQIVKLNAEEASCLPIKPRFHTGASAERAGAGIIALCQSESDSIGRKGSC